MKSKATLILLSSLILTVCSLTQVHAVDDAELEELEKQIEQLESEEKKKAEAEAKARAEVEEKNEKRIAAVYQRLKGIWPEGEWFLDKKTDCLVWNVSRQSI